MSTDPAYWFQQFLNMVQLASFYVPLATAFALIQGITRRVFLSFGDIAMYASFAAIYACFAGLVRGDGEALSAFYALLLAMACTGALGLTIARGLFGKNLVSTAQGFMIASIGLSIALQEVMRLQSMSRDIWIPPLFENLAFIDMPGTFRVKMTLMSAVAISVSIISMVIFLVSLKITRFGQHWRACEQSLPLARLCGIDTDNVVAMTFVVGAGLAAVSGWTSAVSYGGTNFSIGLMLGFKAMFASVVGGFGSLRGAIVGAIALAAIEVGWSAAFSTTYRDVAVFTIIILILVLKPEGLAGSARIRESEDLR
jgi:branched-chain amino acid transport system permease protein